MMNLNRNQPATTSLRLSLASGLRSTLTILLSLMLSVSMASSSLAQVEDYKVKASWIYALVPYIKWHEKPANNLTICTIGLDSVGSFLRRIQKEKSLPISIEEKNRKSPLKDCHIVYIGASEEEQVTDILKNIKDLPIVTVSTIKSFAQMGGIVEFITETDKVSLRINTTSAKNARLIIDSDLLGISEIIQ